METKRLYRSKSNRIVAGICGGLSEYFSVDVSLIRLVWLLFIICTGVVPGLLVYLVAAFIIPEK